MNRRDFLKAVGIGTGGLVALILASEYFYDGYSRFMDLTRKTEIEQLVEKTYGINVIGNPDPYAIADLLILLNETSMHWDMFDHQMKQANSVLINSPIYRGKIASARTNIFTDTIILNYNYPSNVVHELAHLHHGNLPDIMEFNRALRSLINPGYLTEINHLLKRNIWTRHNLYEDVAYITQSVYLLNMHFINYNNEDNLQALDILRVMQEASDRQKLHTKLKLLKDRKFFSHREYDIAMSYL